MLHLSLLNGSVLIFSLLAILPILIHLFSKKKPVKVIFSSIKFIVESQSSQKRKFNLLNLILLIIRTLIIVLFFFALSRPAIKGIKSKKHSKTAVAIIIDNSYSMDYSTNGSTDLEKAKFVASKLNGFLNGKDLVSVYTRSEKWNNFNSVVYSGHFPKKILESIKIIPEAEKLDSLFSKVNFELRNTGYSNRKIFFITDRQKEKIQFNKCKINVISVFNQNEKRNLSCENARYKLIWKDNSFIRTIGFEVKNHCSEKQSDVVCELILDGIKISEKVISLDGNQSKNVYFPITVDKEGYHRGYVIINDERLDFDNKSYFSFLFKKQYRAKIITDKNTIPVSLESALISSGFSFEIVNENTVNKQKFKNEDFLVIYRKNNISKSMESAINSFKNSTLIILDGKIGNEFKSFISENFGIDFGEYISKKSQITEFNKFSPITKDFKSGLDYVSDFWKIHTDKNILISTAKSGILIKLGRGKFLLNTDIGVDKNEFWKSRIFPILFNRIAFNKDNVQSKHYKINNKINLSGQKIILPDNKEFMPNNFGFVAEIRGNYSYQNKEDGKSWFSVNLNYQESNYRKMKKYPSNFIIESGKIKSSILSNNDGLEIWRWIFILVFILLILETIVVLTAQKKIKE